MPENNNTNMMQVSSDIAEKINALGNNMIMSETTSNTSNDATQTAINGNITDPSMLIPKKTRPWVKDNNVRPNDPCPCGATDENGKPIKYKKCCMRKGTYEGYHTV